MPIIVFPEKWMSVALKMPHAGASVIVKQGGKSIAAHCTLVHDSLGSRMLFYSDQTGRLLRGVTAWRTADSLARTTAEKGTRDVNER